MRILNGIGSVACDSLHRPSEDVVSIVKRLS